MFKLERIIPLFLRRCISGCIDMVYDLCILIYKFFILCASFFNPKAKLFVDGRKNVFEMLESKIVQGEKYVWFHVASLGEFEQGRPLIERLKKDFTEYKIVLTFFSPSGYEIRKDYKGADIVSYLPMDTPWEARRFVKIVKPEVAIFVKYEFWLNYLTELKKNNVPTYLISAIFRKSQFFFKWYAFWYRDFLRLFKHIFVQDSDSVLLLDSVFSHDANGNIVEDKRATEAGDTRFDRVAEIAAAAKELPLVKAFKGESRVLVAGSSWPKDEDLFIEYFNTHDNFKLIIAPHEVHEAHIESIISKLKKPFVRYTQASEETAASADCMIIDCIGLLSSIYRYGKLAYIGGGFGVGIHNILEAAVYGMPVVFGPNYKKFNEAVQMKEEGAAFSVENSNELSFVLDSLLYGDGKLLEETSQKAHAYVDRNRGATDLIMSKIFTNEKK